MAYRVHWKRHSCISFNPLSANHTKMAKYTETIRRVLWTNCLSVFDHFVELALKGLTNVFEQQILLFLIYFFSMFSFDPILRTSQNLWFSDIFRGRASRKYCWGENNGLTRKVTRTCPFSFFSSAAIFNWTRGNLFSCIPIFGTLFHFISLSLSIHPENIRRPGV